MKYFMMLTQHEDFQDTENISEAPHNIHIEASFLGALLLNNDSYDHVPDFLRSEHFFAAHHRVLFDLIKRTIERGNLASPETLSHVLAEDASFQDITAHEYLQTLRDGAISSLASNIKEYAQTIYDLHVKRELMDIGRTIFQNAQHNQGTEAEKQIEDAESHLYQLWSTGSFEQNIVPLHEAATAAINTAHLAIQKSGHITGITTGFKDIDNMLGGLHPSDLIIIAGRPSMGKTALATNIAYNTAKAYQTYEQDNTIFETGGKVILFSLEMSSEQLAGRMISSAARISSDKIRKGQLSNQEFERLAKVGDEFTHIPFFIDDTPYLTVAGLRQRARRIKRQHGLNLIVIDYLQLLSSGTRNENRVQEISYITRSLKSLAKELAVPVIALSQLSRQVENRDDSRPQLADLRESGSIEQDADIVAFVYRHAYYLEREKPQQKANESDQEFGDRSGKHQQLLEEKRNIAEFIIGKQRHGPVGTVGLYFDSDFVSFGDLDMEHYKMISP